MTERQASRTLVKSPPELWAECSDAASLGRHLDRFGEIRITRLDPETAVAWEGERARGTVRIEPAGWGTKVILTAVAEEQEAAARAEPPPVEEPPPLEEPPPIEEPPPVEEPAESILEVPPSGPRPGRFARLRAWWLHGGKPRQHTAPEAPVEEPKEPELQSSAQAESPPTETEVALAAALDSLGSAHHRPYSRA
jgi:hypothetical protein